MLQAAPAWSYVIKGVEVLQGNMEISFPADPGLSPGDDIWVYQKNSTGKLVLAGRFKVLSCDLEACKARTSTLKKGATLTSKDYFSTTDLKRDRSRSLNQMAISFGTPLIKGYNLSYFRGMSRDLRLGVKGGVVDSTIRNVNVTGKYFAVTADYRAYTSGAFSLDPAMELGQLRSTLDFKDINGPEFGDNVPYVSLGVNAWVEWPGFFLRGKAAYDHNFFKSEYSDGAADYSVPFRGGLVIFEIGLGVSF